MTPHPASELLNRQNYPPGGPITQRVTSLPTHAYLADTQGTRTARPTQSAPPPAPGTPLVRNHHIPPIVVHFSPKDAPGIHRGPEKSARPGP